MVGCFGYNGPLRQSISGRLSEREKEKRKERREKKCLYVGGPLSPGKKKR